eukprot:6895407-Prymnesium_polylepis.2
MDAVAAKLGVSSPVTVSDSPARKVDSPAGLDASSAPSFFGDGWRSTIHACASCDMGATMPSM